MYTNPLNYVYKSNQDSLISGVDQFSLDPHILHVPIITIPHPLLDLLLPSLISKQIHISNAASLSSTSESSHIKRARGTILQTSTQLNQLRIPNHALIEATNIIR